MKRKTFIASLFAIPLIIKELYAANKPDGYIKSKFPFEFPFLKMNWQMKVTDDLPKITWRQLGPMKIVKDIPYPYYEKRGLLKLRKARR